jgi:TusA-related sulfurtransferase
MQIDLGSLGFAEGGYLLVKRAARQVPPGELIRVTGDAEDLDVQLRAWCRAEGHRFDWQQSPGTKGQALIHAGVAETERWAGAAHVSGEGDTDDDSVAEHPQRSWGLAARGSTIEAGTPEFDFHLTDKVDVWSDEAAHIYQQAVAAQWDPEKAIPWHAPFELTDDLEDAVVQLMTYLIENETAALIVPSRFIAQLHPHFREVMQVLAVQAADEARHIEVFTRRARLKRNKLGRSTIGGQVSLKTLVDEPQFAVASFLLSVLGEGTFLSLLWFIERYAPDPVTATVARLAAQDEARHVAFGLAHLSQHLAREPEFRPRLADAVRVRHDALRHTAGLNDEVFDALLLMAAGSWDHDALRLGSRRVMQLIHDMDEGRRKRLVRLGFPDDEAAALSALHTRNFM